MEKPLKEYRSNGKLLLSAEYLVLHGAWSLAVPTILGQSLAIREGERSGTILWKTLVVSKPWTEVEISPDTWHVIRGVETGRAGFLVKLLKAASEIRGDAAWLKGKEAIAEVEFDISWGLGSSSSLISNVAWWAEVDPFQLSRLLSFGSGYDIACARSDQPLLYRTLDASPEYHPADFLPPFHTQLAFVYLGKKQDSASSVRNYLNKALVREKNLSRISRITKALCQARALDEFEGLMREHESILSEILELPPVKKGLFPDYPGEVKSLGAWGGDFVMITMHQDLQDVKAYFAAKGMDILKPYHEMVNAR